MKAGGRKERIRAAEETGGKGRTWQRSWLLESKLLAKEQRGVEVHGGMGFIAAWVWVADYWDIWAERDRHQWGRVSQAKLCLSLGTPKVIRPSGPLPMWARQSCAMICLGELDNEIEGRPQVLDGHGDSWWEEEQMVYILPLLHWVLWWEFWPTFWVSHLHFETEVITLIHHALCSYWSSSSSYQQLSFYGALCRNENKKLNKQRSRELIP